MDTHTQTSALTALQIYNELMRRIEPDLMSQNIAHLDKKYAGESPQERAFRLEHYRISFMILDESLKELGMEIADDMRVWKKRIEAATNDIPDTSGSISAS